MIAVGLATGSALAAAPESPTAVKATSAVPTGRLLRNVLPTHVALALRVDPREARFSG